MYTARSTTEAYLDHHFAHAVSRIPNGVHIFLQVHVHKLKHQVKLLILMQDIIKPDEVKSA
jgi:hypothetical protein